MSPRVGRVAFNLALFFALVSGILIPLLDESSPSFYVNILALTVSIAFLVVVVLEVRRQARIPPVK